MSPNQQTEQRQRLAKTLGSWLPRYLQELVDKAGLVRLVREDVPERDVIRELMSLMVYALNLSAEVTAFTQRLLEKPDQRVIWSKYLVLLMHEGIDTFPRLIANVDREARAIAHLSGTAFDLAQFRSASVNYKEHLKPIRDDKAFMKWLAEVRNTVAAHHLTRNQGDLRGLIEWVTGAQGQSAEDAVGKDDLLIRRAITLSAAILEFNRDAFRALDSSKLPDFPADVNRYHSLRDSF